MLSLTQVFFLTFDILFDFWFVLIVAPLKRKRSGLRNVLENWVIVAFFRFFLFFNPDPMSSMVIQEPLNTYLFFTVGGILFAILFLSKSSQSKKLRKKLFGMTARDLLDVPPGEFEEMTAELFRALGYKAKATGASGDHGVDVLLRSKEGQKVVVQCKRWRKAVGEPVVRDFYGTMQHEKASHGVIFGTSGFSNQARDWARGKPISLYDGDKFISLMKKAQKQKNSRVSIN